MYVLFDVGGSHIRIGASDDGVNISDPLVYETPEYYQEGMDLITKAIVQLSNGKDIRAIAGGLPGVLERTTGTLLWSPNLRGWEHNSVKDSLAHLCPNVFIENDAALVGLGEAIHGAGKDFEVVMYMTISTGIGGARIVHQKIDLRRVSFEPGHQIIDADSITSVESRASGRSLQKKYKKAPQDITDSSVWSKATSDIAIAVHNSILHWSPDVVVLGGPMILNKPGIDIQDVAERVKSLMVVFPFLPEIKAASLNIKGGLFGALEYAKQKLA
jgi:predicted NBD/HSP70 family sugar kinase